MEFNEKLQNLRKEHNLTQEQLAVKLHISRTAVSKWESGGDRCILVSCSSIGGFEGGKRQPFCNRCNDRCGEKETTECLQ